MKTAVFQFSEIMMQKLFLITGFMAAGKTTAGNQAASILGLPFYELDSLIEREAGLKIFEIFARHGESEFRKLEHEAFSQMLQTVSPPAIVAGGGGLPVYPANQPLLKNCWVIFLDTPWPEIEGRIAALPGQRPLLLGKSVSEIKELWQTRCETYLKFADFVIKDSIQLSQLISSLMTGTGKLNE